MAEIAPPVPSSEKDLKAPEGDFKEWSENTSANGQTFYTRDADEQGQTVKKPEDASGNEPDSHGPSFNNEPCYWTPGTSGNTTQDFANKTGITWYKLENTLGWTYQLTINTNSTYNYTFTTSKDKYGLDVYQTWTTHEVTYTSFDPIITAVSGS